MEQKISFLGRWRVSFLASMVSFCFLMSFASPAMAEWQNGIGDLTYDLTESLSIWDISGSYSDAIATGGIELDYVITQDGRGKLTGTGNASTSMGGVDLDFPVEVKGTVTVKKGVTWVKMTLNGKGTALYEGKLKNYIFSEKVKAQVDPNSQTLMGTAQVRVSALGHTQKATEIFEKSLPEDMDGASLLSLSCAANGKKIGGTADMTLSNGESYGFSVSGKYNAKTDACTLSLKGNTRGPRLKLKVDGSDGNINILVGKVAGQKLIGYNILPASGDPNENLPADMVHIPAGTFSMGDSFAEGNPDELPVRAVTLDAFAMGKYEITNGQYCTYLNSALAQGLIAVTGGVVYQAETGTSFPYCDTSAFNTLSQIAYESGVFTVRTKGGRDMAEDPMVMVSWYGAAAYCNWRSQQEDRPLCYDPNTWSCDFSQMGYRLATEAEWEYASRGGLTGKRFPWGDTISQTQADFYSSSSYDYDVSSVKDQFHFLWNDEDYPATAPVGFFDGGIKYKSNYHWAGSVASYQTADGRNPYGLFDMAGNVFEWCNDWYDGYGSTPQTNPTGPASGTNCVLRGGSWNSTAVVCRVAYRINYIPSNRGVSYGFRLVLDFQ